MGAFALQRSPDLSGEKRAGWGGCLSIGERNGLGREKKDRRPVG